MNSVPDYFGSLVFDDRAMKAKLPSEYTIRSERPSTRGPT